MRCNSRLWPFLVGGGSEYPRRGGAALDFSFADAKFHRCRARLLQHLQPGATEAPDRERRPNRRRRCRRHQRVPGRKYRAGGHCGHRLVNVARMVEGRTARGVSAGGHFDLCDDAYLVWRQRHGNERYARLFAVGLPAVLLAPGSASNSTARSTRQHFDRCIGPLAHFRPNVAAIDDHVRQLVEP